MGKQLLNIRGTHGSGKTTLVRGVIATLPHESIYASRSRPIGYRCILPGNRELFIPGHYETPVGGCDSLNDVGLTYEMIAMALQTGSVVLFEGIWAQHSTPRMLELSKRYDTVIVLLNTPLAECIDSVARRRMGMGIGTTMEKWRVNCEKEQRAVESSCKKLSAAGVEVRSLSRIEAIDALRLELGL